MPGNLSRAGLERWAADHANEVICNFDLRITPGTSIDPRPQHRSLLAPVRRAAERQASPESTSPAAGHPGRDPTSSAQIADQNYSDYSRQFLSPSASLMIKSGLWLELEAIIGFIVGLGLGSLIGQRTVAVIAMIVLEVVLTPIFSRANIPHFINLQRAVVGLATAHLAPGGLPVLGGGGGGPGSTGGNPELLPETTTVAVCVILAWLVGWSILGAWRMMTRDA